MPTLLDTVQAIAWPATLVFLALRFQNQIVEFLLRDRRPRGGDNVRFPPPHAIDTERIRAACREPGVQDYPDERLAKTILDCLLTPQEPAASTAQTQSGSEPELRTEDEP